MGALTIFLLAASNLALLVLGGFLWDDRDHWKTKATLAKQESEARQMCIDRLQDENDELLRQKQRLTKAEPKTQDKPIPVVSGAEARKRVNQMNASYFSAEKHVPNSELLKEQ